MAEYRPGGKAHRALARLGDGPATLAELREAWGGQNETKRRKAWFAVDAMFRDGLIGRSDDRYVLTAAGERQLEALRDAVARDGVPNARVFARPGAAA